MPPPTNSLVVGEVAASVAALMNDTAQTVYTVSAVLPYLRIALKDIDKEFQLNNVPVTNKTAALPIVAIGTDSIPVPGDFVELQSLGERLAGSNDPFVQMTRREFLPDWTQQPVDSLIYYNFEEQLIKFPPGGALLARQLKIEYIRTIYVVLNDTTTPINVINVDSYLHYRTAALCARFIGEDTERADTLDGFAVNASDQVIGIATKGRQVIATRRRPFRAAYRSRGIW